MFSRSVRYGTARFTAANSCSGSPGALEIPLPAANQRLLLEGSHPAMPSYAGVLALSEFEERGIGGLIIVQLGLGFLWVFTPGFHLYSLSKLKSTFRPRIAWLVDRTTIGSFSPEGPRAVVG